MPPRECVFKTKVWVLLRGGGVLSVTRMVLQGLSVCTRPVARSPFAFHVERIAGRTRGSSLPFPVPLSKQNSLWEQSPYVLQYKLINAVKMRVKPPTLTDSGLMLSARLCHRVFP